MSMRRFLAGGLGAATLLLPSWVLAAAEKAEDLVVVADTRNLSGFNLYIANLYNENLWLFAVWAVVFTSLLGVCLGFLMDFIMKRTGIDLSSRKIVEH